MKSIFFISFLILCQMFYAQPTSVQPSGSGTEVDPYLITDWPELYWITQSSARWGYHYKQTDDIDHEALMFWDYMADWDGGQGWTPIGNNWGAAFTGMYDGQNHYISGMYINRGSTDNIGVFGFVLGGTIKNLGIKIIDISGRHHTGALAGYNTNSSIISNCYITKYNGSEGSVTGNTNVGGLVGFNRNHTLIEFSYVSSISVKGYACVGGFVGLTSQDGGAGQPSINDCYTRSIVQRIGGGDTRFGGFAGETNSSKISRSYTTCEVTGFTTKGFSGQVLGANVFADNFWDTECSSQTSTTSTEAAGKPTVEMKTQSTFTNWDFTEVWEISPVDGANYPRLTTNQEAALPVELISFEALQTDEGVELPWQTATEVNNYGFEIERQQSENGTQNSEWKTIGFVEGQGSSNSPKEYSYLDESLEELLFDYDQDQGYDEDRSVQYRLKQIDTDGSFTYYSQTASVDISQIITSIKAAQLPTEYALHQNYPNPFNPTTTIQYDVPHISKNSQFSIPNSQLIALVIYDILGNEVAILVDEHKSPGRYKVQFNAGKLSSGVYFYTLTAGSFKSVKKLVLLR